MALASARACPRAASLARSHPGRFPIDHYQLAFSVRPVPARRVAMGLLSYIQSITFWGVIRMVAKLGASSSAGPFSPPPERLLSEKRARWEQARLTRVAPGFGLSLLFVGFTLCGIWFMQEKAIYP